MQSLEGLLPHSELMQMKAERLMRLLQRSQKDILVYTLRNGAIMPGTTLGDLRTN